jgi:hypothetical protein
MTKEEKQRWLEAFGLTKTEYILSRHSLTDCALCSLSYDINGSEDNMCHVCPMNVFASDSLSLNGCMSRLVKPVNSGIRNQTLQKAAADFYKGAMAIWESTHIRVPKFTEKTSSIWSVAIKKLDLDIAMKYGLNRCTTC